MAREAIRKSRRARLPCWATLYASIVAMLTARILYEAFRIDKDAHFQTAEKWNIPLVVENAVSSEIAVAAFAMTTSVVEHSTAVSGSNRTECPDPIRSRKPLVPKGVCTIYTRLRRDRSGECMCERIGTHFLLLRTVWRTKYGYSFSLRQALLSMTC